MNIDILSKATTKSSAWKFILNARKKKKKKILPCNIVFIRQPSVSWPAVNKNDITRL